jgi:uncharacterized protein (UPF0335 family)
MTTVNVAEAELRQFIERIEQLNAEKADIAETTKEAYAEATVRGYSAKAMRRVISLRKMKADALAEQEAIEAMYRAALGM